MSVQQRYMARMERRKGRSKYFKMQELSGGKNMQKCPYCKKRDIVRSATCGDPECMNKCSNERSAAWVKKFRIPKNHRSLEQSLKV
jgi:hypothetical protein